MKSILLIANYKPNGGGISQQVKLLMEHLSLEHVEYDLFNTKGSVLKRLFLPFRLFLKGFKYDVFHIHTCSDRGFLPALIGIPLGKLLGKSVIVTYHGGGCADFFKKYRYPRYFLKRAGVNIVLNQYTANVYQKYGIQPLVLHNVVELDQMQYVNRTQISPRLLSVRHLRPLYNIKTIIEAFGQISKEYPHATLTILGDGPDRASLENEVNMRNLTNVTFVGQVPNGEIYEFLKKNDIFVSASFEDNMPVSVMEAMNAGNVVIASNVGGVPNMIEHRKNGMLFDPNRVDDLVQCVKYVIEHQDAAIKMSSNAHQSAKEYSWNSFWSCYKKLTDNA